MKEYEALRRRREVGEIAAWVTRRRADAHARAVAAAASWALALADDEDPGRVADLETRARAARDDLAAVDDVLGLLRLAALDSRLRGVRGLEAA